MKLKIKYNSKVLSNDILLADSLYLRTVGLMFKDRPPGAEGLLLDPCRAIHTFFMRYPIDVVFINDRNRVIKILRNVLPWRMTWIYVKANKTLELPAGKLPLDLKEGDQLEVTDA
jgi:uncharacterized protein